MAGLRRALPPRVWRIDRPGAAWHTYRRELQGDVLRVFIDGEIAVETGDVRYVDGGRVGLWSGETQISVRSFRVLAL